MAMAQAAARNKNGRQAFIVPCPSGPRKVGGASLVFPAGVRDLGINTGLYTPLHMTVRQVLLSKGGLAVWGFFPLGTDATSSHNSVAEQNGFKRSSPALTSAWSAPTRRA